MPTIQILRIICMSVSFIIQILSSKCILILFIIHIYCRPHVCRYCSLYKFSVLHMYINALFFTQIYRPLYILLVHIKLRISSTVLRCNEIKDQQNRSHLISSHLNYPLTARVVWAPQMISQPVSSISPCSPLPSGTWRTLDLSIP